MTGRASAIDSEWLDCSRKDEWVKCLCTEYMLEWSSMHYCSQTAIGHWMLIPSISKYDSKNFDDK